MEVIAILYKLVACHMIGDYVFQIDFIARTKGENLWHLLAHCVTYTVPFAIAFGLDWHIIWLLVTHIVVDSMKARWHLIDYVCDQALHITFMAIYLL